MFMVVQVDVLITVEGLALELLLVGLGTSVVLVKLMGRLTLESVLSSTGELAKSLGR